MSSGPLRRETAAFNVDTMRKRMMERVAVPQEMLNDAIKKTHAKLSAKQKDRKEKRECAWKG